MKNKQVRCSKCKRIIKGRPALIATKEVCPLCWSKAHSRTNNQNPDLWAKWTHKNNGNGK